MKKTEEADVNDIRYQTSNNGSKGGLLALLLGGGAIGAYLLFGKNKITNPFDNQSVRNEMADQMAIQFDNASDAMAEVRAEFVYSDRYLGVSVLDANEANIRKTAWEMYCIKHIIGTNYSNIKSNLPKWSESNYKNGNPQRTWVGRPIDDHLLEEMCYEMILRTGYPFNADNLLTNIVGRSGVYKQLLDGVDRIIKDYTAENKTLGEVYLSTILGKDAQWNAKDINAHMTIMPPSVYFTITRKASANKGYHLLKAPGDKVAKATYEYPSSNYQKNAFNYFFTYNNDNKKDEIYFGNCDKWAASFAFMYSKEEIYQKLKSVYQTSSKGFLQFWIIKENSLGSDSINAIKSYVREKGLTSESSLFGIIAPTKATGEADAARLIKTNFESYLTKVFKTAIKKANAEAEKTAMQAELDDLINNVKSYYTQHRSVSFEGRVVYQISTRALIEYSVIGTLPSSMLNISGDGWATVRSIINSLKSYKEDFFKCEVYYQNEADRDTLVIDSLQNLAEVILGVLRDYQQGKCSIKYLGSPITPQKLANLCLFANFINSDSLDSIKWHHVYVGAKKPESELTNLLSETTTTSNVLSNLSLQYIGGTAQDGDNKNAADTGVALANSLTAIVNSTPTTIAPAITAALPLRDWKLNHLTCVVEAQAAASQAVPK